MSAPKKQTAVEWLVEKISLSKLDNRTYLMPTISNEEIEQAKAMEKEQIINAYEQGEEDGYWHPEIGYSRKYKDSKQYYNETYETI